LLVKNLKQRDIDSRQLLCFTHVKQTDARCMSQKHAPGFTLHADGLLQCCP